MQSTVLCARDLMSNKGQKVHNYPLKVAAIEYKVMATEQPKESLVLTEREYKRMESE